MFIANLTLNMDFSPHNKSSDGKIEAMTGGSFAFR